MDGLIGSIDVGSWSFWPTMGGSAPPDGAIPVFKALPMMQELADHIERERPERIVEVGIYKGGSTAMLAALAPGAQILAIELDPGPAPHLEAYRERGGDLAHVRTEFGVDQSDRARVQELVASTFGDEPIDLVIDDASHQLRESRVTLDALLPLVRPGGAYLLEDWSWAHLRSSAWGVAFPGATWPEGPSLTELVFELVMAVGASEGVVERVDVGPFNALARRGAAPLDPATFALREHVPGAEDYAAP